MIEFLFGKECERCSKRTHNLSLFEGIKTCSSCKSNLLQIEKDILFSRERAEAMAKDPVINCPLCNTQMEKNFMFDDDLAIRDKCPSCNAVVFSETEIAIIKEHHYNGGYNDGYDSGHRRGRSSGESSGMATGFVIGSIIN